MITTKKETTAMLHVADVALVFVFCVLYSSFHDGYEGGLLAWAMGLTSLSWYVMIQSPLQPGSYIRTRNVIPAFGSWSHSLFFLGLVLDDYCLLLAGAILLFSIFFYWGRLSHKHFNLALVLRGEITRLGDIEEHIQKTYVSNNRVKLIDSAYSEEHLQIVNEIEWRSLSGSKEERLLMQRREKVPSLGQITFSCLLHGEWRYLEAIRAHIADYLSDDKIQSFTFAYSMDGLHVVNESEWKARVLGTTMYSDKKGDNSRKSH